MTQLPKWFVVMLALTLLVVLTVPAVAAEAKGKIKSVSADKNQFVLTDATGKDWTILVAPKAKILVGGKAGKLSDLKTGDEIQMAYVKDADKLVATEIVRK